ncbi:DUF6328 family protein [Streptomyces sp. NPDC047461]|uniref:DUF6328 family protein n=1 Tax=Streptomyces sp. NPDC047461 TaxID=3155619 RepID=UPI0033DEDBA9
MISSRLAGAGMSVLMLTLTGSVLLVVDVVLGRVEGVIAGSATLLVCGGLWVVLPQFVRRHARRTVGGPGRLGAAGRIELSAAAAHSRRGWPVWFTYRFPAAAVLSAGRSVSPAGGCRHVQQPFGDLPVLHERDA